jgi:ABC-type transport system involved in cytochrome c biogenesis permease component
MKTTANVILPLAWLDIKLYLRESIAVLWTFLMPTALMLGMGLFLPAGAKEAIYPTIIPGMCTIVIITAALIGVTALVVDTREAGVFETLKLLEIGPREVLGMYIVSRGIMCAIMVVIVFALGIALFPVSHFILSAYTITLFFMTIFLGVILFFNMALAIGVFFRSAPSAHVAGMIVSSVLIFAGGCYFDMGELVPSLRFLVMLMPSFYLNNLFSVVLGQTQDVVESALILAIFTVGLTTFNMLFFNSRRRRFD